LVSVLFVSEEDGEKVQCGLVNLEAIDPSALTHAHTHSQFPKKCTLYYYYCDSSGLFIIIVLPPSKRMISA